MTDAATIDVYNKRVKEYSELDNELSEKLWLNKFASLLAPSAYVLDLGCGPGTAAAQLIQQGYTVDAIDASIEMVRLAQSKFGVAARCGDFFDINAVNEYDGIWANFSLLHASADELTDILPLLHLAMRPDGVLHIGMKRGEGSSRDHLGRYYTYYSSDELQALLQEACFDIIDITHGEGCGLAGTVDPWMLILSKAHKNSKT